jgi:hypothetical protein
MSTVTNSVKKPVSFCVDASEVWYFNSKELQEYDPVFYYGCKTKPRNILIKKNIPKTGYMYANFNTLKNAWILSTEDCKKAQLLITKDWVEAHMHSMRDTSNTLTNTIVTSVHHVSSSQILPSPPTTMSSPVISEPIHHTDGGGEEAPPVSCSDVYVKGVHSNRVEYEEAPPLLDLEEHEKFRDSHGNIVEIETRGTKDRKGIRFRVKDVMVAFEMPSLDHTLRRDHVTYMADHYIVYYIRGKGDVVPCNTIKKEQYLTYKGLLRVLFISNSGKADKFQDWAEETLFTVQLGTKDAKESLSMLRHFHVFI